MEKSEYTRIKDSNIRDYVSVRPAGKSFKMPSVSSEPEFLMVERLFGKKLVSELSSEFKDELGDKFEIIGDDAIGGLILVDNTTGKIIYWDLLSAYSEEDDNEAITPDNTFALANNLNMFLKKLIEK